MYCIIQFFGKKKKKDKKRPEFLVLKNQCQYKTLISGSEKMVEKQPVYCEQVLALGDGGGWGGVGSFETTGFTDTWV